VITPAGPRPAVRGGEQRVELGGGQPGHERAVVAFERDREDTFDRRGVLGMLQRGVAVERTDRGQPGVPGPRGAAPVVLEMVQERADRLGVQVVEREFRGRLASVLSGERIVSR